MEAKSKRVLICDDSALMAAAVKCAIEQTRTVEVVAVAADGLQALVKIAEFVPDVVLMDIRMPRLDGIEATKRIKEHFPSVRVIMLTGIEDGPTAARCLQAGADGFCAKSAISTDQLLWAIQSVCYGAGWLDPTVSKSILEALAQSATSDEAALLTIPPLTKREVVLLGLIVEGLSNSQIAQRLSISLDTVKRHIKNLFDKLRVRHRTEAAVLAIRCGLISVA